MNTWDTKENNLTMYHITSKQDSSEYWSNLFGWVGLRSADTFTTEERLTLNLPVGGEWRKAPARLYVCNAFSLNMLPVDGDPVFDLRVVPVTDPVWLIRQFHDEEVTWAVGHADTSRIMANIARVDPAWAAEEASKRKTVRLLRGDRVLVGQYQGTRLPEGATSLPEGASLGWMLLTVR